MAIIDDLKVNEEALQTAITNYEGKRVELENNCLKISNEVRQLDSTWHGEASEKFKSQFDELYNKLKQSDTVMGNIVSNLKKALETYNKAEHEVKIIMDNAEEGTQYL